MRMRKDLMSLTVLAVGIIAIIEAARIVIELFSK